MQMNEGIMIKTKPSRLHRSSKVHLELQPDVATQQFVVNCPNAFKLTPQFIYYRRIGTMLVFLSVSQSQDAPLLAVAVLTCAFREEEAVQVLKKITQN